MKLFFPAIFLACLLFAPIAQAAEPGPEDVVRDFYTWYVPLEAGGGAPLNSEEIYKYVYLPTVSNLRILYSMAMIDWMYFICGQEILPGLINDLVVHPAVPITDTVSLVPVGDSQTKPWILVFVQKEKEGWRITKVEDTNYSALYLR
ncbi:MAG: YbjP/YqhG family protein [Candidatus Adiutrix sp.]|jgi:hypothetical protein|nr:YbjP/YqhG family protein [Candidatus Adiutrix sp.]